MWPSRPSLRMAVSYYSRTELLLTSAPDGAHGAVHAAWLHGPAGAFEQKHTVLNNSLLFNSWWCPYNR